MRNLIVRRLHRSLRWAIVGVFLVNASVPLLHAADDPAPDPAGITTGDKTSAIDGASVLFNDRVLKIDDPCGAISVHGYCGWFGAVALGIFADGAYGAGWNGVGASTYLGVAGRGVTGLIHGDTSQFLVQFGGATLAAVYAFGLTFVVFKVVNSIKSMRVSAAVELEGLDVPEFGMLAYPEDEGLPA